MFLRTVLDIPILATVGCSTQSAAAFVPPDTVSIASGMAVLGSDHAEREAAYQMDEKAYGHAVNRQHRWYETEPPARFVPFRPMTSCGIL